MELPLEKYIEVLNRFTNDQLGEIKLYLAMMLFGFFLIPPEIYFPYKNFFDLVDGISRENLVQVCEVVKEVEKSRDANRIKIESPNEEEEIERILVRMED